MSISFHTVILAILLYFKFINAVLYNGTIAGSKTVSECINGPKTANSELEITTTKLIRMQGYPAEEHLILTEDGYLLTLHRIPGPIGSPIVLLEHGLLLSSFDYIANGKDESLAFLLADEGYDVWLGNQRGSLYSRCHIKYPTSDNRYWNFSFHEMGLYDLPAQIKYITDMKNDDLVYVGHSMGTTTFYVMAIERPDIASKVKAMFGLAPIAFLYHMNRGLTPLTFVLNILSKLLSSGEVFSQHPAYKLLIKVGCMLPFLRDVCANVIFLITGLDSPQLNYSRLPLYLNHVPAGNSAKTFLHYAQNVMTKKFGYFDYGKKGNLLMYNRTDVPEYDLTKIEVPMGIFYADNDRLSDPQDAKHAYKLFRHKILEYGVPDPKFNHIDFVWGINAKTLVYKKLLSVMKDYQ